MIKKRSDFFQNAKFFPIFNIYNSPDDQCVQICMNSKFDAILQPVIFGPSHAALAYGCGAGHVLRGGCIFLRTAQTINQRMEAQLMAMQQKPTTSSTSMRWSE